MGKPRRKKKRESHTQVAQRIRIILWSPLCVTHFLQGKKNCQSFKSQGWEQVLGPTPCRAYIFFVNSIAVAIMCSWYNKPVPYITKCKIKIFLIIFKLQRLFIFKCAIHSKEFSYKIYNKGNYTLDYLIYLTMYLQKYLTFNSYHSCTVFVRISKLYC